MLEKPEEEKPGLEMSLLEKPAEMFLLEKAEEVSLLEKHPANRVKDIPVSTPSQSIPDVGPTEWEVNTLGQVAGDRERPVLEHIQHMS